MKRRQAFLAVGAIFVLMASLLAPLAPTLTVHADPSDVGMPWDPIPVSDCQGLQDIDNNLAGSYTLTTDIDCSGMPGFAPIASGATFEGRLNGQGNTITGLTVPLVDALAGAIITNLNVSSDVEVTSSSTTAAILAKAANDSLIANVHVTGTIAIQPGSSGGGGGMFGGVFSSTISQSSVIVDVDIGETFVSFGGLAGSTEGSKILNNYIITNMTFSGGDILHAGGLSVFDEGSYIANSYTGGSIDDPSQVQDNAGFIFFADAETELVNSFSRLEGGSVCTGGVSACSGLITIGAGATDLSSNYFDQTALGSNRCTGDGNTSCHKVNVAGAQPNYFNNNTTNPPLDEWDFTNIWQTTVGLPTLRSQVNPQPDPVEQLAATIGSTVSINLNWDLPADTGSAALLAQQVYYQAEGESEWHLAPGSEINSYTSTSGNLTGTSLSVVNLTPATSYNFQVVLYNQNGYFASATTSGVTATPGFTVISNCQQLQNLENDPGNNYEMGQNIDCTGFDFEAIGCQGVPFSGILEGNNYTLSNITSDATACTEVGGIFGLTSGALIQDMTVSNPTITGVSEQVIIGALVGFDVGSTFNNIHIVDANFTSNGVLNVNGLVGYVFGPQTTTINQVSFVGTATAATQLGFGGLVGYQAAPVAITNSYIQATLHNTHTEPQDASVFDVIGGLVGAHSPGVDLNIQKSYAALTYTADATPEDRNPPIIGGLVGLYQNNGTTDNQPFLHNSFATTQVNIADVTTDRSAIGGLVGGIVNALDDTDPLDLTGNYFDADQVGTTDCGGTDYPTEGFVFQPATCNPISGQPNYFFNNSSNPPLNSWDFTNIWQTTSNWPVFSEEAKHTITPIPPERLKPRPPVPPSPNPAVTVPLVTSLAAALAEAKDTDDGTGGAAAVASSGGGIINELKKLLAHVPAVILVNFPYLLFALLLVAVIFLLIEMRRQATRLKQLNVLLAEQRSVAEKRDTFWHLAANYLRAPITLLMGGADLLALTGTKGVEVVQLTTLSKSLQSKVGTIMQQIEHSHSLQGIKPPPEEKPRRVWSSVGFWLPLIAVAVLIGLTNYVAQSWRHLNVSTVSLVVQALVYLLVAFALYWALGAFGVVNRRRRSAEQLLHEQEEALDKARLRLMRQTATDLDADVSRVQLLLAKVSGASKAKPIMQEGASRLRHLVDSFQLLISAQNHRLGSLSAAGSYTSLGKALQTALAELQPEIDNKHLTIDQPAKLNLRVPGSPNLNNQVISSVLSNAVAFSSSGSMIRLAAQPTEDGGVQLTVGDHGSGIAPSEAGHLFEPFTKADGQAALQLDHGGLGINLYLDRQIMDHLGGQITVNSVAGQGTTVVLNWPQTAPQPAKPGVLVKPGTQTV